jgi:chromosome partitioning protein
MSRLIAFSSLKGGVGKTTCTIFTAEYLRAAGKRLLLVDLDPQHSLTTYFVAQGFEPAEGRDVLSFLSTRRARLEDYVVGKDGMALLPGTLALSELNTRPPRGRRLRRLVRRLSSTEQDLDYDYVLIDTAPTMSSLSLVSLPAAHYLLLVTTPEVWSARAVHLFLEGLPKQISRVGSRLTDVAVVANSYDASRQSDRRVLSAMKDTLPEYVVEPPIPFSKAVRNYVLNHRERSDYLQPVRSAVSDVISSILGEPYEQT